MTEVVMAVKSGKPELVVAAKSGKPEPTWPAFKPTKPDPVLGKKEMSPEQSLIEFISTSAALHGVKKMSLRALEWDLLKVFPYNIMPANAAAWYMAKRKFYAEQPPAQQLLPFLLNKYPEKFIVAKQQVEFLEVYSKETAKRKLNYLVEFGIDAYFSHKVDEFGVYFFDPAYYEITEPFHESLRLCVPGVRSRLVSAFFQQEKQFHYQQHTNNLASVSKKPEVKVMTNITGVIVSMVNNQYGFLKFGSGQKALFCAKGLYRDGWQYTGDPLRLPAMFFDAYQIGIGSESSRDDCDWFAVLVWCGKKPAPKHYCSKADFSSTPIGFPKPVSLPTEGRKLRQPSSSMMIGQIVNIRKNGAIISIREDSMEKVFVPGWSKENNKRPGLWLTTLTGDTVGLRDLVAYYVDTNESMPGFTAVGKNVMVLKEYEEVSSTKKRRNRMSTAMSSGANYDPRDCDSDSQLSDDVSVSLEDSDSEMVSDSELEWLENDITELMEKDGPQSNTHHLFKKLKKTLAETRAKTQKSPIGGRDGGRDSGMGSTKTTPSGKAVTPLKVGKVKNDGKMFWRTKAAFASVDEDYRSSEDEDYASGDEVPAFVEPTRVRLTSTMTSASNTSRRQTIKKSVEEVRKESLPYWVRAISLPEEFDAETGLFVPVDKWYSEDKDPDYCPPEEDDDNYFKNLAELSEDEDKVEGGAGDGAEDAEDVEVKEAEDSEAQAKEVEDMEDEEETAIQEEDLGEELVLLVKEAMEEIHEDLLEGKHRPSAVRIPTPEKIVITKPEEEGEEGKEVEEIITIEEPIKDFKMWHSYNYVNFVQNIYNDEYLDDEYKRDDEYVPPAIILDEDLDYDEYDVDEEIPAAELEGLVEEQKQDLNKAGNYIAIWVPVHSVKERKERAVEEKAEAARRKEEAERRKEEKEVARKEEAAKKVAAEAAVAAQGLVAAAGKQAEKLILDSGLTTAMDKMKLEKPILESGLTPAMDKMKLKDKPVDEDSPKKQRSNSGGMKVTRARVGSSSPPSLQLLEAVSMEFDKVDKMVKEGESECLPSGKVLEMAEKINQTPETQ